MLLILKKISIYKSTFSVKYNKFVKSVHKIVKLRINYFIYTFFSFFFGRSSLYGALSH